MIHLPHWAPAYLVRPLAWALVHSLWEVALLAVLYRAVALATRGRATRVRYALGCAALLASLAAPAATLVRLAEPPPAPASTAAAATVAAGAAAPQAALVDPDPRSATTGILDRVAVAVDARTGSIALGWGLGAFLGLTLLAGSWIRAGRLAGGESRPAPAGQLQVLERLRTRLGVRRKVRLRYSPRVDTPSLVGWLRPTILLPSTTSRLPATSPDLLEPVLAHELAHVRRHDYLANLAQAVAERLLFFHPAFHWLSGQVRREREACCDDVAAGCCSGGVLAYARALADLESFRSRLPALGAAEGDLLRRIRRLIDPPARARRRPALAALLLAGCAGVAGLSLLSRSQAITVIDGLDPVQLVAGRRVTGSPALSAEVDGYRYLFADAASRARFLIDPHRYTVRNVAICPASGRRVLPGAFRVIDGRIVLFCCPEIDSHAVRLARARLAELGARASD